MVAFARSEFELNKEVEGGGTVREHYQAMYRRTKVLPDALRDAPAVPPLAAHLWQHFHELHHERGEVGMKPARITATMLRDWCWATGAKLELWERAALRRIDTLWLEVHAK